MNMHRRKFLQGSAAVGAFSSEAFGADAISVASIHDLSGGLDIYGKPMVDARQRFPIGWLILRIGSEAHLGQKTTSPGDE